MNDLALSDSDEESESLEEDDYFENFRINDDDEKSEESDVINKDEDNDQNNKQSKSHKQKLSVQKDALELKKQIEELEYKDPEFYDYLMKNDQELIEFDVSDFESNSEKGDSYEDDIEIEEESNSENEVN
jgi:nucleolar complex protein 2